MPSSETLEEPPPWLLHPVHSPVNGTIHRREGLKLADSCLMRRSITALPGPADPSVNGLGKVRIFGEHARGIEASGSAAVGSERWVFLIPEVGLSLVGAAVVAV